MADFHELLISVASLILETTDLNLFYFSIEYISRPLLVSMFLCFGHFFSLFELCAESSSEHTNSCV